MFGCVGRSRGRLSTRSDRLSGLKQVLGIPSDLAQVLGPEHLRWRLGHNRLRITDPTAGLLSRGSKVRVGPPLATGTRKLRPRSPQPAVKRRRRRRPVGRIASRLPGQAPGAPKFTHVNEGGPGALSQSAPRRSGASIMVNAQLFGGGPGSPDSGLIEWPPARASRAPPAPARYLGTGVRHTPVEPAPRAAASQLRPVLRRARAAR
jgi:hypothetical protein